MRIMGIDLGIHKVAWSVWQDGELEEVLTYRSGRSTIHQQLADMQVIMVSTLNHWNPDHVFIEDTLIGNNRKYSIQLSRTMGMVLSACGTYYEINSRIGFSPGIYTVNVSTWKKEVIGKGNATKEDVRFWLDDHNSAYSVVCGGDQDMYDAAAIGYYGVLIQRRTEAMAKPG